MFKHLLFTALATLLSYFTLLGNPTDIKKSNDYDRSVKINALYDSIVAANRYVEKLDSSTFFNLPVGFKGGADKDPSFAIIINSAVIKPEGAYFTAYMSITNPMDGSKLAFEAQNIPFSFKGGLKGDIRLVLVSQQNINICKDVSLSIMPGTFVEWDCNGFKDLKIKGQVDFASKTFLPATETGELKKDTTSRIRAYIETEVKTLNDLTLSFSISPFQIKGVPDITFSCKNLVLDYSDYVNPAEVKFPANYLSSFPTGNQTLWRGIYIGDASIILGPKFNKKESKTPTTFSAKDLIIDENGFTGLLSVSTTILSLKDGDLGGWQFSVDNLSVKLLASKLSAASFSGKMHIPVFKDSSTLNYNANIDLEGKYSFTVSPSDSLEFSLFGNSKLVLYSNSSVNITVDSSKFVPTAILTGNIYINAPFSKDNPKNNLNLAKVEFQEMRISTVEPVFDVKYIGVSGLSQGAFAAFPISIDKIALRTTSNKVKLSIGLVVNLMNSSDEGFGGKTTITLVADRDGFKFHYTGIEIDKIRIDIVKKGAFELHGGIAFAKDDPIYGNGFRGDLDATFGGKIRVEAIALFGKVKGTRYFFVDAMLTLPPPGIQAGPLNFYGFGGGLYYHMKQKPGLNDKESFGASRSGLVYQPNDSISIGIMANVKFGVVSEKIIDADVKFEIVFNASGGLNKIGFLGVAKCIVPGVDIVPDKIKAAAQKLAGGGQLEFKPVDAALALRVSMEMDFEHDVFHAELEAFVNVGPVLKGIGPDGSCGKCVMHIEPHKWYMHIGTQTNPLGMKLLGMISVHGYFMVGDEIPTGLPLNPTVASILNITPEKAASNRKNDKLSNGSGIAFGAGFDISTGDLNFLCFYANFQVGAGFDILLVNYPNDAYCLGHQPPLGINSWYAKGQAYAYLKGDIGIKVKILGRKKKFEILSIAAAAILRVEGPNPLYLEGQAGGRFSLLGGLVSGQCNFKVTYGEKCEVVMPTQPSPLEDIQMIGAITPKEKDKEVDVFVTPQAVFNIPVEKEFSISDINEKSHKYKANLRKFFFKKGDIDVAGAAQWNADKSVVVFQPNDILYPNTDYTLEVEVGFVEYLNGQWIPCKSEDSTIITELKKCVFTTGPLPTVIPDRLISYCYPIKRQYNFYPKEYPEGYITFNIGLAPYFDPGADYTQVARFAPVGGGKSYASSLAYNTSSKTATFSIPKDLPNNKIFKLELTNVPTTIGKIDKNVTEQTKTSDLQNDSNYMQVRTRDAIGTISKDEEIVFLTYGLRTSKYNTFTEKISFNELNIDYLKTLSPYVYDLKATIYGDELFDDFELNGSGDYPPLVKRTASLEDAPWYKQALEPIIYKDYPLLGSATITWRDINKYGVPVVGEIKIIQQNLNAQVTDNEMETGVTSQLNDKTHYMYGLPYYWSQDYSDIRMKLANLYPSMKHSDPHVNAILKKVIWPVVDKGAYPVTFEYVLPGINKVTSSKKIVFNNPFGIVQPSL